MKRINVSIDEDLLELIEDYCDKNYINRSRFIAQCCHQFLSAQEMPEALKSFSSTMKKFLESSSAELSDDDTKNIDKLEKLADILSK